MSPTDVQEIIAYPQDDNTLEREDAGEIRSKLEGF
jgi:hypothetical protein